MKKTPIIIGIVCVLAAGAVTGAVLLKRHNSKNESQLEDIAVERRTITNIIDGSATLLPKDEYSITAIVTGDVISAPFEEGDIVAKDTLLYQIDAEDVETSIESAELGIEKAQRSLNEAAESVNDLTVTSKDSGTVKTVNVKKGDTIQSGAAIAECYNDSTMEIRVPFNAAECGGIYAGQSAELTMSDTGAAVYGTVKSVDASTTALEGNMVVKYVTIQVSNPGAIKQGDKATAQIGSIMCNDAGEFKYLSEFTITAKASGKIEQLNVKEGGKISSGAVAAVLSSDSVTNQYENAKNSLRDAELSKDKAEKQLENYEIKAPIAGTVVTKNTKAGDTLDTNKSSTEPLAVIYDLTSLKFDMSVDEVEISQVSVGQEVTITADAVEGTYTGIIEKVGIDGTATNGVTTYPVTVSLTEYGDLLPGMNIDAEIVVAKAENVLAVPVSAVKRNNVVYVRGDKTDEKDNAPDGYKSVKVETGLSDDSYVEIISGLTEEDKIKNDSVATNNTTMNTETQQQMTMGGMGGMAGGGGGMPGGGGGGMPGGGGGGPR